VLKFRIVFNPDPDSAQHFRFMRSRIQFQIQGSYFIQPSKENMTGLTALQNINFFAFLNFCGSFFHLLIRIQPTKINSDPDPHPEYCVSALVMNIASVLLDIFPAV
jgi:hypothetical protein